MREISPEFTKSVPNWRSLGISGHAAMTVACYVISSSRLNDHTFRRRVRSTDRGGPHITMVLILSRVVK